jgi:tRNA pseudouridine55 synthase
MDGLLIVDKPAGPTSHDVVARTRRALGERRIGHTGTLDPAASGVLPLVVGRATRLARFLSAADKVYEATIRLGVATDTYDLEGAATGGLYCGPMPAAEAIDRALDAFRGTFDQRPPPFSAKKIDGRRSYAIAREAARRPGAGTRPTPAAVSVTVRAIELVSAESDCISLRVTCSAGFYMRALAHDLGELLGIGAHLIALRRTQSGDATLDNAVPLAAIEREPATAVARLIPLSRMLPGLSTVTLTTEGVRLALHGRDVGPGDAAIRGVADARFFRLVDPAGDLVAIATPSGTRGLLHPAVVLV